MLLKIQEIKHTLGVVLQTIIIKIKKEQEEEQASIVLS